MDIKTRSVRLLLLGTILLSSCAGLKITEAPPAQTGEHGLTYITRELKNLSGHTYVQTIEHGEILTDAALIEFFQRYHQLNGRITRSDYLFLVELSEDPLLRNLLTSKTVRPDKHGVDYRTCRLKAKLSTMPHVGSDASRRGAYSQDPAQIDSANPVDRIKVALLLRSLECADFRIRLGEILIDDARDSCTEYGGALVLSPQLDCPVWLHPLSPFSLGDHDYKPPAELYSSGCLAIWHNHAATTEEPANPFSVDNSPQAGPSGTLRGSLAQVGGDMWQCYIHGIDAAIVTPVGGGCFNLDFVNSEGIVLDLGVYSYIELD